MFRSSKAVRGAKKNAASSRHIEQLEQRTLLSAAATATLPTVMVATNASPSTVALNNFFADNAVGAGDVVVVMTTPNGPIPIDLFEGTPQVQTTVNNFLAYVDNGEYNTTIVHRAAKGFVIQGGGFTTTGQPIDTSLSGTGIPDQPFFHDTAGTIAMAKTSQPNTATSQWFINLVDNSSLDASGFSPFGKTLYNGLSVATAISNLPTVDAGTLIPDLAGSNPPFPLPLENASGGTVASNLVTTPMARVNPLTFTATSDNTNLVTPSIASDGTMTLTYGAGVTGRAHVTVTAHDLGGGTSVQTFLVDLGVTGDETSVVVGSGGHKAVSLQQADGTVVTVKVGGKGSATILADGDTLSQAVQKNGTDLITGTNAVIGSISTTGTNSGTTLNITTTGGKVGSIGGLSTDAAVGTINAKTVNLTGNLTAGGPVKNINLHGASGGTLTIPAGGSVNIKSSTAVTNESIASGSTIKNISAPGWNAAGTSTSNISAPSIGTFNVKGDMAFTAITLTGAGTELKNLNVSGTINSVAVNASGNISSIAAGSMSDDIIFAGVVPSLVSPDQGAVFPTGFTTNQTINNIRVKANFDSTDIAAATLGNLSLGKIQTTHVVVLGSPNFGLAAHSIKAVTGTDTTTGKKISLHKLTAATDSTSFEDFIVKLL